MASTSGASAAGAVVLIVEDEPLLMIHAVDLMEEAGFQVLEARNADEAILLLAARSDIRVVFTDVHMPGSMTGIELALAIRRRWPPIALVVTSGHVRPEPGELPDRSLFFGKPYDDKGLVEAVRRLAA